MTDEEVQRECRQIVVEEAEAARQRVIERIAKLCARHIAEKFAAQVVAGWEKQQRDACPKTN